MNRSAFILAVITGAAAHAASPPADLGGGLLYYRVHELPADIPTPPSGKAGPCVVDLRFAKTGSLGASTFRSWVQFSASAKTPVFLLENAATSPVLLAAFPAGSGPGLLILAPKGEALHPDIGVRVSRDQDRRAYEALEKGLSLDSLLNDNPAKPRIDEAYLEKEHLADGDAPEIDPAKIPPSPLVDVLLQRAVQLYRGLVALKKI